MVKIDGLSISQRKAIGALTIGHDAKKTAGLAGVHRNTVSRWLNHDPEFRAALKASVKSTTKNTTRTRKR